MSNIDPNVIASAAGNSDALSLPAGREYALSFTSEAAFTLTLQRLAGDNVTWDDVYDSDGIVTIDSASGRRSLIVASGTWRMVVSDYNDEPITMWGIGV